MNPQTDRLDNEADLGSFTQKSTADSPISHSPMDGHSANFSHDPVSNHPSHSSISDSPQVSDHAHSVITDHTVAPVGNVVSAQSSDSVPIPDTAMFAQAPKRQRMPGLRRFLKLPGASNEPRAYLVEYALVLISIGILLSVVISMFSTILKYNQDNLGYFSSFAYQASIALIASLIVVMPLVLLLTGRLHITEAVAPEVKNSGWRKFFLGFFLLNVGVWGIGFAIAFFYDCISYIASFGISNIRVLPWRSLLANSLATALLSFTFWLYSHDYRRQSFNKTIISKALNYSLIVCAVVLTFIYLGTAFKNQRASFIDAAISGDLSSIQNEISADSSGQLPGSLSDIKLNDQQKARAAKYSYSYNQNTDGYQVCAVFSTDTTAAANKGSQNPLDAFSNSTYTPSTDTSYAGSGNSDPTIHGKGRQCFETANYNANPYTDNSSSSSSLNQPDSTSTNTSPSTYSQ